MNTAFSKGSTDEEKFTRFAAGGAASFVAALFGGVFGFAWMVTMTKLLGPKDFGVLGPFLNVFWIMSNILPLGVPYSMVTFISRVYEKSPLDAKKYITAGNKILSVIGLAVLFFMVALAVLLYLCKVINLFFMLLGIAVSLALLGRQMFLSTVAVITGIQRIDFAAISYTSFPICMCFISTLLVLFVQHKFNTVLTSELDIIGGALGISISTFCALFVVLFFLKKSKIITLRDFYNLRERYDKKLFKEMLTFGWLTCLAITGGAIIVNIASVVVAFIARNFEWFGKNAGENLTQAGYFSSAFMYAMAPQLIFGISLALVPAISEALAQDKKQLMQKYFTLAMKYCTAIIVFFLVIYSTLIGEIIEILSGKAYPSKLMGKITFILAVGMGFSGLFGLLINLLIGLKKPSVAAVVTTLLLIFEPILITILCAVFKNIFAAGISFSVVHFIGVVCLAVYVTRKFNLRIVVRYILLALIAGIVTWSVLQILPFLLKGFAVFVGAGAALLIFALVYLFGGGLDSDDINTLSEIFVSLKLKFVVSFLRYLEKLLRFSPFYKVLGLIVLLLATVHCNAWSSYSKRWEGHLDNGKYFFPHLLTCGNINNDGKDEILIIDVDGYGHFLQWNGLKISEVWLTSYPLVEKIKKVLIGNIDTDGRNEIVTLDENGFIVVMKKDDYNIQKMCENCIKSKEFKKQYTIKDISLFDINKDKKQELVVSAFSKESKKNELIVFLWDGKQFVVEGNYPLSLGSNDYVTGILSNNISNIATAIYIYCTNDKKENIFYQVYFDEEGIHLGKPLKYQETGFFIRQTFIDDLEEDGEDEIFFIGLKTGLHEEPKYKTVIANIEKNLFVKKDEIDMQNFNFLIPCDLNKSGRKEIVLANYDTFFSILVSSKIEIVINDEILSLHPLPRFKDDSIFIPISYISDCTVVTSNSKIILTRGSRKIILDKTTKEARVFSGKDKGGVKAKVSFVYDKDILYIEGRSAAKFLNFYFNWDLLSETININY